MGTVEKNRFSLKKGGLFPFGVVADRRGVQFTFAAYEGKKAGICLYHRSSGERQYIPAEKKYQTGNLYSIYVRGLRAEEYDYTLQYDDIEILDPYAKKLSGHESWGSSLKKVGKEGVCGRLDFAAGGMERDVPPEISYENLYLYQLHVRGFTKHTSSGVKGKGTFQGIMEKIPYLKELGVNGLLVLPVYDFDEILENGLEDVTREHLERYGKQNLEEKTEEKKRRLNYWGYTRRAAWLVPKASYASDTAYPEKELKELIRRLHEENILFLMEMYFPEGTSTVMIQEDLRYWIVEYHVDGFRINDNVAPMQVLAADPIIGSVKLLANNWAEEAVYGKEAALKKKVLAEANESFLRHMRRFLKSDEGQIGAVLYHMRHNPEKKASVNYITQFNTFTLQDLVSYDVKHNEENGENGRDGTDFNYSWNCGVEGKTRKKAVLNLRQRQVRNALLLLYLSQGTPMLLAGDEFGNSQEGNNNAYCQDNEISWLNWNQLKKNQELFLFVKELIALRKEHPMLHKAEELTGRDYISCGCPDISYHGTKSWYLDNSNYSRVVGIMLCGDYALLDKVNRDWDFYLAYNFHWEPHDYELPKPNSGGKWEILKDTSEQAVLEKKQLTVPERTVVLLASEPTAKKKKRERK
ncbi:MAG: alpha-amylase family glycosyl hydrolase [Acetivibrio ethanolgignens]